MAAKKYEVGADGAEWASGQLGTPVEPGTEVELELSDEQETALVAAGWLVETGSQSKKKGG